jgi:uncharacterized membrane protein YphA (DoxX/SURF4 family)
VTRASGRKIEERKLESTIFSGGTVPVQVVATKGYSTTHIDGALFFLRIGSGLFLAVTFGWQKLFGYFILVHSGKSLATSGLAPLIRNMGFPAPAVLAVYAVLNESFGAFLVACGLWTRLASSLAALSMAGALFVSLRLGEEPLRAGLYLVFFSTLALTGPGKFSIDYLLDRRHRRLSSQFNPRGANKR